MSCESLKQSLTMPFASSSKKFKLISVYDVPYSARSSRDGKTIYIDRHLPRTMDYKGKQIHVDPFVMLHEAAGKALFDRSELKY